MKRAVVVLCLTAGCSLPGTEAKDAFPPLEPLLGERFAADADAEAAPEPLEPAEAAFWWKRYRDPELDALVERVLDANFEIAAAAARVREADALLRVAQGNRGPSLDAGFRGTRTFSRIDRFGANLGRIYDTSLRPSFTASWQADLFGRLAATERARVSTLLATEGDRQALVHSLVATAVRLRVGLAVISDRVALATSIVESRRETLAIVQRRYELGTGAVSAVDVRLARENLAAAQAAIPPLELERQQTLHALDELLGQKPGTGLAPGATTTELPELAPPPLGIPAGLLDRRPDLVASELRTEAAAAEVDVAIASRWPDLTLSATIGWDGNRLGELFDAETLLGEIVGDLMVPLFASGRLEAEQDAARERLEAQAATYASTVLGALREVEDAYVGERALREQLELVVRQREEARIAERLARERYERGLENLLVVLDTERRRANAEDLALQLRERVWNARTDLHLALGGDWFTEDASVEEQPEGSL